MKNCPFHNHRQVLLFYLVWGLGISLLAAVILIWLRNRDILGDLFDHSMLIGATGKTHEGLRPYTDIRSPMQSAVYLFNSLAEMLFGHTFLGLTKGGLLQAIGGGGLIFWLTKTQTNALTALMVTAAITLGGLSQHVEFFYNPIGIICAAIVIIGLAKNPQLDNWHSPQTILIWLALIIGGMNKLNFQGITMAVGGTLLLFARASGQLSTTQLWRQISVLLACGLLLPFAFELAWTGASPSQWWAEVVTRPTARHEAATHWVSFDIFTRPPSDFYHHILFPYLGGIGFVTVLIAAVWATIATRHQQSRGTHVVRLILTLEGVIGCCLLMVTNNETISLTSLSFLIVTVALILGIPPTDKSSVYRQGFLLIACLPWVVNGAYSAWHGSRVLYGPHGPDRNRFERLVNAPRNLSYFEGVRFHSDHLAQLTDLSETLREMENDDGEIEGLLFGPAMEWLERSYPQNIVKDMPVWYDEGTTFAEGDQPWFAQTMKAGNVDKLLVQSEWEHWTRDISTWLNTEFRPTPIENRYILYTPIKKSTTSATPFDLGLPSPRIFRDHTSSNTDPRMTTGSRKLALQETSLGDVWGAVEEATWSWQLTPHHLTGQTVVESDSAGANGSVEIHIIATDESGQEEVLYQTTVMLDSDSSTTHEYFDIRPYGRALRWEIRPSIGASSFKAGWRELRIAHSGPTGETPARPLDSSLQPGVATPGTDYAATDFFWFHNDPESLAEDAIPSVPFEQWFKPKEGVNHVQTRIEIDESSMGATSGPIVVVISCYRNGRYEIARELTVLSSNIDNIVLDGWVPEPDTWVILQTRHADLTLPAMRISKIQWMEPTEP